MKIGNHKISDHSPTYFIADIGANHDGSLERAKRLIQMCAESGANAAKFQHFKAETIVSDAGFKSLDKKYLSHQSSWDKSVFEVYQDASIEISWDNELKNTCDRYGIDYMTTPYDQALVDHIYPLVPAYKIGSGDITWVQHIKYIASKGKPVLLACGASTLDEIVRAVKSIIAINSDVAVLQCNTNYTGQLDNLDHINLNVIKTLKSMFPDLCIGLSDHTHGHATAIGAVALGCRIIEKHFTDDNSRVGPDHGFAMNPSSWKLMVDTTRDLERALGSGIKTIEKNEEDTVVIQRRSIRVSKKLWSGEALTNEAVTMLRPCPVDAIEPWELDDYLGRKLAKDVQEGDYLKASDFE
jgi:N-acetylneuraminate synthase